jgi:hypothetical protein
VVGYEERGVKKLRMAKSKKNKNKPKLNLTVPEEQRNKLEQMASLESIDSVSATTMARA